MNMNTWTKQSCGISTWMLTWFAHRKNVQEFNKYSNLFSVVRSGEFTQPLLCGHKKLHTRFPRQNKQDYIWDCSLQGVGGGGGNVNRHLCIRAAYICTSMYLQKVHWSNRHFATLTVEKQYYVLYPGWRIIFGSWIRIRISIRVKSWILDPH